MSNAVRNVRWSLLSLPLLLAGCMGGPSESLPQMGELTKFHTDTLEETNDPGKRLPTTPPGGKVYADSSRSPMPVVPDSGHDNLPR